MYITRIFLLILFIYGVLLLFFPLRGGLLYSFLLFLGLWVTDLIRTRKEPPPTGQRTFKTPVYLGEACQVEVVVKNPLPRPIRVRVKDEPPYEASVSGVAGKHLVIPAKGSGFIRYELFPAQRGSFAFGRLNLEYAGGLSLYARRCALEMKDSLRVYPYLTALNERFQRLLPGAEPVAAQYRKLSETGREFSQLREFQPGDDYRKINWKVTAHVGKPILNEYSPEKDQSVYLLFDTGRLLYDQLPEGGRRLDFVLDSAFLLAYNILEQGDMVGGLSFQQKVDRFLPAGKGAHHLRLFLERFYDLQAVMKESDYKAAFAFWQKKSKKRSLLFVYTDIIDAESSKELVHHLSHIARRHLVVCVLLPHPYLERVVTTPVKNMKQLYKKGVVLELRAERDYLKRLLAGRGIKVLDTDTGSIQRSAVRHYLYLKHKGVF